MAGFKLFLKEKMQRSFFSLSSSVRELLYTDYIGTLPDELLIYLFKFLPVRDRKNARSVCKRWHEILWNTRCLAEDEMVFLNVNNYSEFGQTRKKFWFLRVKDLRTVNDLTFWRENGANVVVLEICGVLLNLPVLYEILQYCPNLEKLHMWGPRQVEENDFSCTELRLDLQLVLIDLPKLRDLRFLFLSDYTFPVLSKITAWTSKLKYIGFSYRFGSPIPTYKDINLEIIDLVERNSRTLVEVNFWQCPFVDQLFLRRVVEAVGPSLIGLYLTNNYLDAASNFLIVDKLSNLEILDLSDNPVLLEDSDLVSLKKLKVLLLSRSDVSCEALLSVCKITQLQQLDLANCYYLTSDGLCSAFRENKFTQLVHLRLSENIQINDDVLNVITPKLPKLLKLELDDCNNVTPVGIAFVARNCKLLKRLYLRWCSNLTDVVAINDLEKLEKLNLCGCLRLTDQSVANFKLAALTSIDLYHVNCTSDGLLSLIKNCPKLRVFHCSGILLTIDADMRKNEKRLGHILSVMTKFDLMTRENLQNLLMNSPDDVVEAQL